MMRIAFLLVILGCSSSPRAQDDAAVPPVDVTPVPDCCDLDGPPIDAAVDAPIDAPPPGLVTVHVFSPFDGRPFAARVLFAGPHDELIADVMTDAQGHAAVAMAAGYVTMIRPSNTTGFDLTTVLGVKQGDTIEIGVYGGDFTELGTETIVLPALPGNPGAQVFTPCGFLSTQQPVYVNPACRQGVGVLGRSSGPTPMYSYLANHTMTAGATVQMPAWQPAATTQVTLTGLPQSTTISPFLEMFTDVGLRYDEADKDFSTGGGRGPVQSFFHAPLAGDLLYRSTLRRSDDNQLGDQAVYVRTPAAAAVTFAMSDLTARWLSPTAIDLGGPSPAFAWVQEGEDTGTIGWFSTRYFGSAGFVRWDIVGPFLNRGRPGPLLSAGTFTLPQLPDPGLRISVFSDIYYARIRLLALNPEVTYDELRPTIARLFDFEMAWVSDFSQLDVAALFALPNVQLARFSESRAVQR